MTKKRIAIILLVFLLLIPLGLFGWFYLNTANPMPEALAALQSSEAMTVQENGWLVFTPTHVTPTTGLIIYPGGLVGPRAYAPLAHAIAASEYQVVIVPMPFNLAVFGVNRAAEVIDAFPHIDQWAIGGHSLGGVMASQFVDKNRAKVDGLVLWAAFPPDEVDLSTSQLKALSIYGTRDGLSSLEEIEQSRPQLPDDAIFQAIEGGNHAQFGWYGPQEGDLPATISREEQQEQIVKGTIMFLKQIQDQNLENLPNFEGVEAIAFDGENVYIPVETDQGSEMAGYLVAGKIEPDLSSLTVNPAAVVVISTAKQYR